MQRIQTLILSVLLIAVVFSGTTVSAAATNLPAGMLIGDQDGIRVSVDGEYFIDAEALEAGDVITKQLSILNTEDYSYKLTMTAEPLEETGPLKLLDEVNCTLKLDGQVLYDGRIRGDEGINMIQNALNLGTYKSGEQKTLDITLTVSPEMKKYYWTISESLFKWNFNAVQTDTSGGNGKDPDPDRAGDDDDPDGITDPEEIITGPKTGDVIKYGLVVLVPTMVLIMGILLFSKQRRKEKSIRR